MSVSTIIVIQIDHNYQKLERSLHKRRAILIGKHLQLYVQLKNQRKSRQAQTEVEIENVGKGYTKDTAAQDIWSVDVGTHVDELATLVVLARCDHV